MMLHAGQKVICIDDKIRYPSDPPTRLVEGQEYTIATVFCHWMGDGVTLVELLSDPYPGWFADRFHPVAKKKTDISVFTKMLKRKEVKEDA